MKELLLLLSLTIAYTSGAAISKYVNENSRCVNLEKNVYVSYEYSDLPRCALWCIDTIGTSQFVFEKYSNKCSCMESTECTISKRRGAEIGRVSLLDTHPLVGSVSPENEPYCKTTDYKSKSTIELESDCLDLCVKDNKCWYYLHDPSTKTCYLSIPSDTCFDSSETLVDPHRKRLEFIGPYGSYTVKPYKDNKKQFYTSTNTSVTVSGEPNMDRHMCSVKCLTLTSCSMFLVDDSGTCHLIEDVGAIDDPVLEANVPVVYSLVFNHTKFPKFNITATAVDTSVVHFELPTVEKIETIISNIEVNYGKTYVNTDGQMDRTLAILLLASSCAFLLSFAAKVLYFS